jgi:hypothetical protein
MRKPEPPKGKRYTLPYLTGPRGDAGMLDVSPPILVSTMRRRVVVSNGRPAVTDASPLSFVLLALDDVLEYTAVVHWELGPNLRGAAPPDQFVSLHLDLPSATTVTFLGRQMAACGCHCLLVRCAPKSGRMECCRGFVTSLRRATGSRSTDPRNVVHRVALRHHWVARQVICGFVRRRGAAVDAG